MKYCPICKTCYDDVEDRCQKDRIFLVEAFPGLRLVDQKYRIDALIGQGGMGAVYRATHIELDRVVALKVVLPDFVSSGETLERFRREARAAARLNHTSVITIYDFGVLTNGRAYLAMELLSGRSLRDEIEKAGMLSPKRVLDIIKPVCEAVQAAHNAGVIHRDLKPDNIVLETTEAGLELVKVVDFGIAKLKESAGIKSMTLTGPGLVMGTPHYMSPEQCKGEELDIRSDIYSLGVMLYEMITGHVPFDAPTPSAVIIQHAIDPPRRMSQLRRDVKPELEEAVMKSLAKNRLARQQNVMELYADLERAIQPSIPITSSQEIKTSPPPPPPPPPKPRSPYATPRDVEAVDPDNLHSSRHAETVSEPALIKPAAEQAPMSAPSASPALSSSSSYSSSSSVSSKSDASFKPTLAEAADGLDEMDEMDARNKKDYGDVLEEAAAATMPLNDLDAEANELLQHTSDIATMPVTLREVAVLQGHEHVVKSISYTPDGKYLASASSDGAIKIWDLKKKRVRGALRGHELSVNALAVSPNGDLLASAGSDGSVRIWDLANEKELANFNNYEGSLRAVAFAPNNRWLALANNANIEMWDISTKQRLALLKGHVRLVEAVEFSRDGSLIISGGVDESVRFWDANKRTYIGMISCPEHCINAISSSVDGLLATAGKDHTIRLWDIASRTDLALLEGHEESIRALVFSSRGDYLISGDWSGVIKLWDTATGVEMVSMEAHDGAVMTVAFSPDEKQIASGGYDQLIKLWNVEGLIDI